MRKPSRWLLAAPLAALVGIGCGGREPETYPYKPTTSPELEAMKAGMMKSMQTKSYRNPNKAQAGK